MSGTPIEALDLAALLCSRVCHDLISPVGAIVNGLEVLAEEKDEETKTFALDLIKKSATTASAKLQFCRIAFGAAGSAGAQIDTGDEAQLVPRCVIEIRARWQRNVEIDLLVIDRRRRGAHGDQHHQQRAHQLQGEHSLRHGRRRGRHADHQ